MKPIIPFIIKYVVLKKDGKISISYSQAHDEYLNLKTATMGHQCSIDYKIREDLKFYRTNITKPKSIKIYVNKEFYKEVVY